MICIAWHGFPQYAARCVGAFVVSTSERVVVVATKPKVPIAGMESCCRCEIRWVDETTCSDTLMELLGECPRVLVMTGWGIPLFNRFRDEARDQGARIIGMVDNNFCFSLHEIVKSFRFRILIRRHYDAFFVPGKSGRKLLRFYGVPDRLITEGMYSADASIFHDGKPLTERPKKIIYVGQFVERKNVVRMCEAFNCANSNGEWSLDLYGTGPLREVLSQTIKQSGRQTIFLHDFLQPVDLAEKYREARAFCLPSVEEHWGLVVHEAALSGCVLLLSEAVGASMDFAGNENLIEFSPLAKDSLAKAFGRVMTMSGELLDWAGAESVRLGRDKASVEKFVQGLRSLCAANCRPAQSVSGRRRRRRSGY